MSSHRSHPSKRWLQWTVLGLGVVMVSLVSTTGSALAGEKGFLEGSATVWSTGADETVKKPLWLPGTVYTEDGMVLQTFKANSGAQKKPWKPPANGGKMRLHKEVMDHWAPDTGMTVITLVPFGPRGNFYFHTKDINGPRGYMEYLGEGKNGCPNYRYWFDKGDASGR